MQTDFVLRSYTSFDAPAVVDLVNADAVETLNARRAVVDAAGNVRLSRYVPATSERVVVANSQHDLVGYAYLADKEQAIVYEVGGAVHPNSWGRGVGRKLLDWAEQRAKAQSQHAPAAVKTVLQTNLFEAEQPAIKLFSRAGFSKVREWLHFEIELQTAPALSVLPFGLQIRPMDLENDWDVVGPAMDEAFADHWGALPPSIPDTSSEETLLEDPESLDDAPEDETYSNTPGFCYVLMDQDTVAGGILCNARLVERDDTGRVGSVFVRPAYRRQGIGRELMLTAFDAFWRHEIRRIILDTDAESFSESLKFYSALGMQPYRREFLYEKEIRPGNDVRRLTK